MTTWWKERLEESCVQEGRCVARKGEKERKTSGVKTFSELAHPLASAYVCPCGHRERAHPAPSAAINCYFQQVPCRSLSSPAVPPPEHTCPTPQGPPSRPRTAVRSSLGRLAVSQNGWEHCGELSKKPQSSLNSGANGIVRVLNKNPPMPRFAVSPSQVWKGKQRMLQGRYSAAMDHHGAHGLRRPLVGGVLKTHTTFRAQH